MYQLDLTLKAMVRVVGWVAIPILFSSCVLSTDRPIEDFPTPAIQNSRSVEEGADAKPTNTTSTQVASTSSIFQAPIARQPSSTGVATWPPVFLQSSYIAPVSPPVDIWDRMRRGFALPELENSALVERFATFFAKRSGIFSEQNTGPRKFLFYILEEIEARGLPTELALLPFVESAYNPHAQSPKKALGLWQFMPRTGLDFALDQNILTDERKHIILSTRAALDYLTKLYRMFGDWHLALAAYSSGEGRVQKTIDKQIKLGLPTAYSHLALPNETKEYVPRLLAMKEIISNPSYYRVALAKIPNQAYFQAVDLSHNMDVDMIAELSGTDKQLLKELNPGYHKTVYFAHYMPNILLPSDKVEQFLSNGRVMDFEKRESKWHLQKLLKTLKVSEVAHLYNTPLKEFLLMNPVNHNVLIKAGSTVVVYRHPARERMPLIKDPQLQIQKPTSPLKKKMKVNKK
ncbi:MAG: transglycosylase SLT domain-containing protein [Gammaproteobacteria bacterium]|nr:transglycosylase SLT domain-containing protein [Gammaproteobacteria bacterium]